MIFGNNGKDPEKDGSKDPEKAGQDGQKTTPDEGKTFEKNTVFVCVQDCWQDMRRYRRGDELTGTTCPPWFAVKDADKK